MRIPALSLVPLAAVLASAALAAQPAAPAARDAAAAPAPRRPAGEVRAGTPVSGLLSAGDSVLRDGSYADAWTYRGRKGERISVSLAAPKFDAFLTVDMEGGAGTLARDDDGGGGTDARLSLELLVDGTYLIVANSFEARETGPYTLRVESTLAGGSVPPAKDWAAAFPGGGDPAERYALLVGIEEYPKDQEDLDGPAADVRLMRRELVERYGFRPENVVTLADREATREAVVQAVRRHLGQAGEDGVAVFYFSGHGTRLDGNFPAGGAPDAERDGKDEAMAVWGGNERTELIVDDELGALFGELRAGRGLFVFDACNSGGFLRDEDVAGGPPRRVVVSAAAEHESSWLSGRAWPGGSRESVFTHFLVEKLESAGPAATFAQVVDATFSPTTRYAKERFRRAQSPRADGTDLQTSIAEFLKKR